MNRMDDDSNTLEKLSRLISRVFQVTGPSENTNLVRKNITLINDAFRSVGSPIKSHSGGSRTDGTNIESSDVDAMEVWTNIIVIVDSETPNECDSSNTLYLRADSTRSNGGYVRLVPITESMLTSICSSTVETTSEVKFISSEKFNKFLLGQIAYSFKGLHEYDVYRHGPCVSVSTNPILNIKPSRVPGNKVQSDNSVLGAKVQCDYRVPENKVQRDNSVSGTKVQRDYRVQESKVQSDNSVRREKVQRDYRVPENKVQRDNSVQGKKVPPDYRVPGSKVQRDNSVQGKKVPPDYRLPENKVQSDNSIQGNKVQRDYRVPERKVQSDNSVLGAKVQCDYRVLENKVQSDNSVLGTKVQHDYSVQESKKQSDNSVLGTKVQRDYRVPESNVQSDNSVLGTKVQRDYRVPESKVQSDNSVLGAKVQRDYRLPESKVQSDNRILGNKVQSDHASAFELREWPSSAREWSERERKHNWPQQETIGKIRRLKWHVVPVGDPTSENPDLEWRLSFLLGERELMWSFNETQIHCYVILKRLRERLLDPLAPDQISSYHLKTVVLWVSEENDVDSWTEDRLITCVRRCLEYLSSRIEARNLKHYFITANNLFRHKLSNPEQRKILVENIEEIRTDLVKFIMNAGLPDNYKLNYWYWEMSGGHLDRFLHLCGEDEKLDVVYTMYKRRSHTYIRLYALFSECIEIIVNPPDSNGRCYDMYKDVKLDEVDQIFRTPLKQFLNIRCGIITVVSRQYTMKLTEKEIIACEMMFKKGTNFDFLTGTLYLATFYLITSRYRECRDIVTRQLSPPENCCIYVGVCCEKREVVLGLPNYQTRQQSVRFVSPDNTCVHMNHVFDVLFSTADIPFMPYPLKFECAIYRTYAGMNACYLLHPCVYAYVILFFASFFEKDLYGTGKVLLLLEDFINATQIESYGFRPMNILGCCHYLVGNIDRAFSCFTTSLHVKDTRPFQYAENAAAVHLAILANDVYNGVTNNWIETMYRRTVGTLYV